MNDPRQMTPLEVCQAGLAALRERLDPEGTIRFLQQFEGGRGDYTAERNGWLDGLSVDEIVAAITQRRTMPDANNPA